MTDPMYVYAQSGQVSIGGEFQDKTWLAFYQTEVKDTETCKYLGMATVDFPIQYPLRLDNGFIIQENDYYRKYE